MNEIDTHLDESLAEPPPECFELAARLDNLMSKFGLRRWRLGPVASRTVVDSCLETLKQWRTQARLVGDELKSFNVKYSELKRVSENTCAQLNISLEEMTDRYKKAFVEQTEYRSLAESKEAAADAMRVANNALVAENTELKQHLLAKGLGRWPWNPPEPQATVSAPSPPVAATDRPIDVQRHSGWWPKNIPTTQDLIAVLGATAVPARPWDSPDDVPGPVCWLRGGTGDHMIIAVTAEGVRTRDFKCSWKDIQIQPFQCSTDRKTWRPCTK